MKLFAYTGLIMGFVGGELPVDFQRDIRPILADNCYHCHGPDEKTREANLRLDTREGAMAEREDGTTIVPHQSKQSALYARITAEGEEKMPPADSGRQLTQEQIELIKKWIDEGAPWKEHWAFVTPVPTVPSHELADWRSRGPIDRIVRDRLRAEGLDLSPAAPSEKLLRRATLDLTGLPPTLDELDAFLGDASPDAYDRALDRLFASPRYGEHLAVDWLDAARYADTNGYQEDRTRTMWPWRDWLIDAFNQNLPFDQFTVQQLAGDLLPDATDQTRLATGFHRNHMLNGEGGRIPEESRVEYCFDRVETTATVWMGLTLGCARCHDHKYDPFTQNDYYSLMAYFNSVDEVGGVDRGGNANPVMKVPTQEQKSRRRALDVEIAELERMIAAPADLSAAAQEVFEKSLQERVKSASLTTPWVPLIPKDFQSTGGATLTLQDDLSVRVEGKNPVNDAYTVSALIPAGEWSAVRLEATPDPSFTDGRLARSDSGNFVLTKVTFSLVQQGAPTIPIEIRSAIADHEQAGLPASHAIDEDPSTGWAVLSDNMQVERQIVLVFGERLWLNADAVLVVDLAHASRHKHHNIGRFRLSATSVPNPGLAPASEIPHYVLASLASAKEERPEPLKRVLSDYFRRAATERPELRAQVRDRKQQIDELEKSMVESMVLRDLDKPRPTYVLERGAYDKPDHDRPVSADIPEVFGSLKAESPDNRLSLAQWLVDPSHPLTARVTVNRWWQSLFGIGLVKTVEDFGSQGEPPTHQPLLDWLARELVDSGWDVKATLRSILTSEVYRQDSRVSRDLVERDPQNRLLARGPRHRLTSLDLRDQTLFLSGLLVDTMGGPGVNPYQPSNVWTDFSLGKIQYKQDTGSALYRRSVYTFWRRSVGPTMFFDTPTRQFCSVRRQLTNTPLQALAMLNDPAQVEGARALAALLMKKSETPENRFRLAFRMATARFPNPEELTVLTRRYEQSLSQFEADPTAAERLLEVGESKPDYMAPVELAAHTVVMGVILNLDEAVTKE